MMERLNVWFFALLILLLSDVHVNGAVLVKTSEVGQRAIHGFYCGHQIANVYVAVCTLGMKRKRSVLEGEREAKSFLRRFNRATSSTDIVQECCNEGCHIEEVLEYC
ncbi:insulin-like peptide 01 isoform X2 [Oculina patagonica]